MRYRAPLTLFLYSLLAALLSPAPDLRAEGEAQLAKVSNVRFSDAGGTVAWDAVDGNVAGYRVIWRRGTSPSNTIHFVSADADSYGYPDANTYANFNPDAHGYPNPNAHRNAAAAAGGADRAGLRRQRPLLE